MTRVLEFDEYHVYVLERVVSVEPITVETMADYHESGSVRVSAKKGVKVVLKSVHDAQKTALPR